MPVARGLYGFAVPSHGNVHGSYYYQMSQEHHIFDSEDGEASEVGQESDAQDVNKEASEAAAAKPKLV